MGYGCLFLQQGVRMAMVASPEATLHGMARFTLPVGAAIPARSGLACSSTSVPQLGGSG